MRVTLVIIDGCRPDVLQEVQTPNIDELIRLGASTLEAQTVSPSITLPVHFSIFTSLKPIDHGVLTNTGRPDRYSHPFNIFCLAKSQGWNTAFFTNWEFLRELTPPGFLNCSVHLDNSTDPQGDLEVAEAASGYLAKRPDGLAFVYLGCLDQAGHDFGFESDDYRRRLETADQAFGLVLETLRVHETVPNIILLSDHGGHGNHHSEARPENLTVPWIAAGAGVRRGWTLTSRVSVLDTAPTLAEFMGLPVHPLWLGRPVEEIWAEPLECPSVRSKISCGNGWR